MGRMIPPREPKKGPSVSSESSLHFSRPFNGDLIIFRSWSHPDLFYLTDILITKIEDSETWRQAFSFHRGDTNAPSNTSSGKKAQEHQEDLAKAIFHDIATSPPDWRDVSLKTLGGAVKNRVTTCVIDYNTATMYH